MATIYLDQGLTQQAPNPALADSNGNFGFWAPAGNYTYSITASGVTGKLYNITLPANPSSIFAGNNTYTGSNTFAQQIVSTVATGTAPLSIASTTVVPNLNAQLFNGKTAPVGNIVGDTDTQTLTNKTLTNPALSNPTSQHYLGSGTAPTCSVTGAGTGATCDATTVSGATDFSGIITFHTGTSPSASGTFTLTFNAAYGTSGFCTLMLVNFGGAWNARATVIGTNFTTNVAQENWDNNAVSLTASLTYQMVYVCGGK